MAVVKYDVTVAGGAPTISPGVDEVVLTTKDYLEFSPPKGTTGQILVQVTGSNPNDPRVVVAVSDKGTIKLQPPTVDASGNVVIAFTRVGGDPVTGAPGFPP